MIFDGKKQDTHAGGSGCGCGASTLCGYVMNRMKAGELNRVLFMATGALLSPTSTLQGESIPSVAHAVVISNTGQEASDDSVFYCVLGRRADLCDCADSYR